MRLSQLIQHVYGARIIQGGDPEIKDLSTDSRTVKPGDLFVAIRGGQIVDRHDFVNQATTAGAVGVVVEKPVSVANTVSVVQVPSARDALGSLADQFYDSPAKSLKMIGVTGTKGKTTTATLIHAILNLAGFHPGLVGTVEYRIGDRVLPSFQTTPEAHELQRMLREMVEEHCQAAVMEVSSHGLALGRVASIPFESAIFTNLTRDHLDFHGTMDDYLAAKALLFKGLSADSFAVMNADDPSTEIILSNCRAKVIKFGLSENADVRLINGITNWDGTRMQVQTPAGKIDLALALVGRFHQPNVLAAIATAIVMGIPPKVFVEAIKEIRLPGRFEAIQCGQDFGVIVDYAHTPDALEKVLSSAREFTSRRLICIFGCDGDRDHGKRPQMGKIATQFADLTIVTSSHPGTEDPNAIIQDVIKGMEDESNIIVEQDRLEAITLAIQSAKSGDLIVIAGKGHEPYQIVGRDKLPFDDREVARRILQKLG